MPASREPAAAAICPRCNRVLPAGAPPACVYCGTPLASGAARNTNLGFGFVSRPQRDPLVGQTIGGRFQIEELIGQGGMGKVYRARHLALDRLVCLKVLKTALLEDPTLVGRFEREAKAASRLNHPNGIQVLDFGRNEVDGSLFIVMELVQGKDLRVMLRDDWPIPEERLCGIIGQALAALGAAHAHSVIHRDLKPENIMVEVRADQGDVVKVLDFGIAKILDSDAPGLTRNDVVCGTPQYMAPEQATGSALDARCDLYAVGVILYQMVTGHLPFDGQNSMEVLTRHVNELPVPPRQRQPGTPISEAMEALILRALEKDPLLRPQTAEEFRQLLLAVPRAGAAALLAARSPTPPHVTLPTLPPASSVPLEPPAEARAASPGGRRKLALAAGGAAVLVLVAAAALFLRAPAPLQVPIAVATPGGVSAFQTGRALPREPEKARELVARASEWQAANDTGTARDLLEKAIELDAENAEAHYRLGGLFLNSQPERARREYEAARRLNPPRYGDVVDQILKGLSP